MNSQVGIEEFLDNMDDNNYLSVGFAYTLFSAGWYQGKGFWDLHLGVKGYADSNVPKGFFELGKMGFDSEKAVSYDLSRLSSHGTALLELGLGYSRTFLDDKLSLGIRGKFLAGLANYDVYTENMYLHSAGDEWNAYSKGRVKLSAPGVFVRYDEKGVFDEFDFDDSYSPAGYGAGVDLGAEYDLSAVGSEQDGLLGALLSRLKVSAAVTDLGFIHWQRGSSVAMYAEGESAIKTDEFVFDLEDDDVSLEDHLQDELDALKEAADLREDPEGSRSRNTRLRTNLNLGLEYSLVWDKLSAGLLSSTRFGTYHDMTEFTFSLNARPTRWLGVTGSYSFMHSAFNTFGAALHLVPSRVLNLFVAADYAIPHVSPKYYLPTTSKGVNFQFGLSIPIGSRQAD